MNKKILKCNDTEIEKYKFHQHKSSFSIDNIDVNEIVVPNKVCFVKMDFKYFIGYADTKKIRTLCIFLPKMSAYRRDIDKTECLSFTIKYEKLLERYNEIWKKTTLVKLSKKNFTVNVHAMRNM